MPKFLITLIKNFEVDTDDWSPPGETNAYEEHLLEETIGNDKNTITDADRCDALRRMMEKDGIEEVLDLNEVSELDFTIEVVP